jgi:ABC-2 type transport system ATP-binding protein
VSSGTGKTRAAVETHGLGKRFGVKWALEDCDVSLPTGSVSALVGPNGAGKTTLLRLLVGLSRPSVGTALVLGHSPEQSEEFLSSVGYLAQEPPLYKRLSVDDHLEMCAHMNRNWDTGAARARLTHLQIPFDRPVGTLSGGQRAQVALGLALAKKPQLLLLDEPVAALDPLARREFLASLSEAVAEGDLTVVLSSHQLSELKRVCDHLVLLAASRTQLCGDIDQVVAEHKVLVGPRRSSARVDRKFAVIKATHTERQTRLLIRSAVPIVDPDWEVSGIGLEEIILAYMGLDTGVDGGPLSLCDGAA